MQDPNIVIYRDIDKFGCSRCSGKAITFVISVKLMDGKKPNEYFMMYDKSYGIPVWIEKGLLAQLENKPILISMKKGLFKGLKIEIGSEILKSQ